jgi:hypothetical protein
VIVMVVVNHLPSDSFRMKGCQGPNHWRRPLERQLVFFTHRWQGEQISLWQNRPKRTSPTHFCDN